MQARVTSQISIQASPEQVFKYLSHLKYHPLWNPHVREFSSNKALKLGSRYQADSVILGLNITASNFVTSFQPGKRLEIENQSGLIKYSVRYDLTPVGAKTILKYTIQVVIDNDSFAFTMPIVKKLAKRELRSDLEALKIAVEHQLS